MNYFIFVILLSIFTANAKAELVKLICKGLKSDQRLISVNYQKIAINTPSGINQIYAPTEVYFERSFLPAKVAVGNNGQNLNDGECGIANNILARNINYSLRFKNFERYTAILSQQQLDETSKILSFKAYPTIINCPGNLYQFDSVTTAKEGIFDINGDSSVACK